VTRALYVFGSLERAGAQLRTIEICRELRTDGSFEFDFCSLDLGPTEMEADVAATGGRSVVVSIRSPRFLAAFSDLLRRGRYDIVHTEPQFLSGLVVWLAARRRVPVRVVAVHNAVGEPGQLARKRVVRLVLANGAFIWAMRWLMTRYATNVVGVSRSALDSVLPGRWQRRASSTVVYNGTDLEPFRGPPDRDGVRAEFGWPPDSRIVVNVGRFSRQKNHAVILETARRLHQEDPRVRLLLIGGGKGVDGFEEAIGDLGLRDVVAITNRRSDVPRLLLASDAFFFPSLWEGLPGSPLEALAAGIPVVASDIPPMREVAASIPGRIWLAPAEDVEGHLAHLRTALATPGDRDAARDAFARSPFTLEEAVRSYRALYRLDAPGAPDAGRGSAGAGRSSPTVLYTSSDASPQSGAFRCLLDMAHDAGRQGYRSIVVLPGRGRPSSFAGHDATYELALPRPKRGRSAVGYVRDVVGTALAAVRVARIIRRERVDVVHANEILDVYAGLAARLAGVPCIWHVRADMSSWPRALQAVLPRLVGALATRIVCVSASVRREVFDRHGVSGDRIAVIHDAAPDPDVFNERVDGRPVREELGIGADDLLVVLVSKLVEPKGHEVLVRAVPEVLRTFPRARFAIVGGEVEGEHHRRYAERLYRLPRELGVEHAVTFLGYRADVASAMAAADVVVHCPTHADPFPGVILQAMALGRAVIAADIGGAREQIVHETGILAAPSDPLALATSIVELLKDADRRTTLGHAAAARVRSEFGAERFVERLLSVYETVGAGVNRERPT
jgi:glycosyltransferase involved in cell wall biosynthesis